MNKVNTVKIATILAIAGLLLLSGCLGNNSENNAGTPAPTNTATPTTINTPFPVTTVTTNTSAGINGSVTNLSTKSSNESSNALVATGADWCKVGDNKTIVGKIFTVKGTLTDKKGNSLCHFESVETYTKTNSTTTINRYFSQDGSINQTDSKTVSANGTEIANSSASASSSSSH